MGERDDKKGGYRRSYLVEGTATSSNDPCTFYALWLFYTRNRLNHLVLARRRRSGTFGLLRYCFYRFYPAAHLEVSEEVRVARKP